MTEPQSRSAPPDAPPDARRDLAGEPILEAIRWRLADLEGRMEALRRRYRRQVMHGRMAVWVAAERAIALMIWELFP